jgi:hypothetical protein
MFQPMTLPTFRRAKQIFGEDRMPLPRYLPLVLLLSATLMGCSAGGPTRTAAEAHDDTADGPLLYGRLGVSVDQVTVQ